MITINCQDGIFVPSEEFGSWYCCQNIWWKNMLISWSVRITFFKSSTGLWRRRCLSVILVSVDRSTHRAVSSSSAGGWRVKSISNLSLYLHWHSWMTLANHSSVTFQVAGSHWPRRNGLLLETDCIACKKQNQQKKLKIIVTICSSTSECNF